MHEISFSKKLPLSATEFKLKMFLLVILACIALANAHGSYPHAQPYDFGYAIRDHHSHQYRQEAGNGLGAVTGRYGYVDGRGTVLYNNYGVGAGYGVPIYGGYGLGYGGYGLGYGVPRGIGSL
ncbi:hypothetical protein AVEN_177715-1, partial [Araneus ventricosus]